MQTFKEVKRTATHVTYQYQTALGWLMYGILAGWVIAIIAGLPRWLELAFVAFILVYFAAIYVPSRSRSQLIKEAMRSGMIQMTGSRWSFTNPLHITLPLTYLGTEQDGGEVKPTEGESNAADEQRDV